MNKPKDISHNKPARTRARTYYNDFSDRQASLYRRRWLVLTILGICIVCVLWACTAKAAEFSRLQADVSLLREARSRMKSGLPPAMPRGWRCNAHAFIIVYDHKQRCARLASVQQWEMEQQLQGYLEACKAKHTGASTKDKSPAFLGGDAGAKPAALISNLAFPVFPPFRNKLGELAPALPATSSIATSQLASDLPAAFGDGIPPAQFDTPLLTTQADAATPPASANFDFALRDFIAGKFKDFNGQLSSEDSEVLADGCMAFSDPLYWAGIVMAESGCRLKVCNSIGCYGPFQINEPAHRRTLSRMGLDIFHSFQDQVTFALHLFETRGYQPWLASKKNTRKYSAQLKAEWERKGNAQ